MLLEKTAFTTFTIFLCLAIFKHLETPPQHNNPPPKQIEQKQFSFKANTRSVIEKPLPNIVERRAVEKERAPASINMERSSDLIKLEGLFADLIFEPADNISQLSELQKKIAGTYQHSKITTPNIYKWDLMFVYYLMIEEGLSLDQINEFKDLAEAGYDNSLREVLYSNDFYARISQFKGIDTQNSDYESTLHQAIARMEKANAVMSPVKTEAEFRASLNEVNYTNEQKQEMITGFYGSEKEEF